MTGEADSDAGERVHAELAGEAALRNVATLVAAGSMTAGLWTAVVEEVARVLDAPAVWLLRFEPGGSMTVLAALSDPAFVVDTQWPLDGTRVLGERVRESGFPASVGVPIIVDGTVWGAICVGPERPTRFPRTPSADWPASRS